MRKQRTYAWPRFWFEAGARVDSNDGFLQDPMSKWAQYMPSRAKPFEEIASIPCLVLLGEPGMGKTRALRSEHERLEAGGKKSLWLEFGRLGSTVEYLIQKLFRNPTFDRWQAEEGNLLHLFLDALDEGLLDIKNLHKILIDQLRDRTNSTDRSRLFLRLSCRPAQWPQSMGQELAELWGASRYGEFRLAALREIDVKTAAVARGLDPAGFLAAVRKYEVEPLAARPITLEMLMAAYRDSHSFPKSKVVLYEQGCRRLCEEEAVGSDRQKVGKLSSSERLMIASRLAALSVFTNRNSFELKPNYESGERGIALSEAEGGQEPVQGNLLAVREPEIRETFELSGLFSSSSDGLITWAHKTYAEFLAARYLTSRQLPVSKILSLLVHPDDPNHKIPTSLHETASWLASLRTEILEALLESNTEVLLYSDAASFTNATRSEILAHILDKIRAGTLFPDLFETGRAWERLNHPGLNEQLRPLITLKGTVTARFVAFRIASQCHCTALQTEILAVALDSGEKDEVRCWAIETLELIGDPQARVGLRPLLTSTPPVAHRLLSHALEALWPDHVSAGEVFALLGKVKTEEELTEYSGLFAHEPNMIPQGPEVVVALRWIQHSAYLAIHQVESFVEDILLASWKAFDHPSVIIALAETLIAISRQHLHLALRDLQKAYHADEEKRHRLLSALLDIFSEQEEDILWVLHYTFRLISSQDVGWLLEELAADSTAGRRMLLARLIATNFDERDEVQFARVCETRNRFPELDEYLRRRLGPVELNSKLAEQFRSSYEFEKARQEEEEEGEEERARRDKDRPSPREKIEELLHEAETGNADAWWRINLYLLEDERGYWHEMEGNLTTSPGWVAAEAETRAKLLVAARLYLLHGDLSGTEINYSSGTLYRRPMAGYRALRLIQQEDLECFLSLPPERWSVWVPAVVYFLQFGGDDQSEESNSLFARAYCMAETVVHCEIRKALSAHMTHSPASTPSLLYPIGKILDLPMAELLWVMFLGADPISGAAESIFRLLLRFGFPAALARAAESLREDSLAEQQSWSFAIKVAVWLLTESADHGWPLVGPAFQKNPEFGKQLWKAIPAPHDVPRLPLSALGESYLWLAEHFSSEEDSDSDPVFWLKNSLLQQIVNSGTLEACLLLGSICREFPGDESLLWRLQQAWEKFRQETFPWPSPRQLRTFIEGEIVRLVRTEVELLNAICESLERLQQEMQGQCPAAMDLWGKVSKQKYKPNDEPHLSDYVNRYLTRDLKDRGIIAHREVEIRRRNSPDGTGGEHLDILISVREPVNREMLNVIIEVKCAWNGSLYSDLSAQLVERYLKDFPGRSGIYLVGWFNCPQWTKSDSRCRASTKLDFEVMRQKLARQAEELSSSRGLRVRVFVLNAALR